MSDYNIGFQSGLRYAVYIAKRQHLHNKYQAENQPSYHNCTDHQCYGCRADEAMTIQTLLEVAVEGVQDEKEIDTIPEIITYNRWLYEEINRLQKANKELKERLAIKDDVICASRLVIEEYERKLKQLRTETSMSVIKDTINDMLR